ncbi:MAG: nitrilase-related carbon-nitrogen hydrolase [Deferribacterales bacterium]
MKVHIAQTSPILGNVEKNAEKHFEIIKEAVASGCDLVMFPELSLTGYYLLDLVYEVAMDQSHPIYQQFLEMSKDIAIVFGYVEESEDRRFFNSAAFLHRGRTVHTHRKVYLPDYTLFEEGRYFAAGKDFQAFDTEFGKFGILICEDSFHMSALYILSQSGVQNILILSNSPARGNLEEGHDAANVWQTSNSYVAGVLTVNLVYANRVGVEDGVSFWGGSEAYDARGKKLARLAMFKEDRGCVEINMKTVRRARIETPFLRDEKSYILKKHLEREQ